MIFNAQLCIWKNGFPSPVPSSQPSPWHTCLPLCCGQNPCRGDTGVCGARLPASRQKWLRIGWRLPCDGWSHCCAGGACSWLACCDSWVHGGGSFLWNVVDCGWRIVRTNDRWSCFHTLINLWKRIHWRSEISNHSPSLFLFFYLTVISRIISWTHMLLLFVTPFFFKVIKILLTKALMKIIIVKCVNRMKKLQTDKKGTFFACMIPASSYLLTVHPLPLKCFSPCALRQM